MPQWTLHATSLRFLLPLVHPLAVLAGVRVNQEPLALLDKNWDAHQQAIVHNSALAHVARSRVAFDRRLGLGHGVFHLLWELHGHRAALIHGHRHAQTVLEEAAII